MTWEEIGYADEMKVIRNSLSTQNYPTRDKHSEQEEADYLRGRANARRDHELQKEFGSDHE